MKKILIPALLVVSAAFAPGLRDAVEFPERACEIAQEVARPLFWHVWDELLNRQIAHWTKPAANAEKCRNGGRDCRLARSRAFSSTFF